LFLCRTHVIYEVDNVGNVLYANPATQRILERSPEELIGINVFDLIAYSHKEIVKENFYSSIQKQEDKRYNEFPCLKKDGEIVWLSQHFRNDFEIINGVKKFKGGKGVARDITVQFYAQLQLERSEEKCRNIMENMDLGYLEVDLDGRILRAYDKFLQMTGYTKKDLIGKVADEILIPEEYKDLIKVQDASRVNGAVSTYEVQMIKKNGEPLWVLISGGPVLDEKGNTIGSIGIHYDLSTQKKVEEELKLAKQQAEDAQIVEQEFLANMSHEIRTPLNAIIGMSHLLYDTRPTKEQLEYFNIIRNSANFLHTLISDVLDMAKIEAGKIEPKNEPFDLIGLLYTLQRTFELKSGDKDLKIICEIDDKIQNLIKGDETLLNQILLNLVGNAEKFTESGSIIIKTSVIEEDTKGLRIRFDVTDTGIGIPQDKLELVFQKFRQVNSKQQSKTKGTGLGLAIVKSLVECMDGFVEVKSIDGEGTTFSFELPFQKTSLKRISKISTLEVIDNDFSKKHVLLVEDNALNTLYATRLLEKWDIELKHAVDGLEAVSMANKYHFDLILMDIQMPNLNGYEATIQIRNTININKVTPIIALTASALATEKNKAKEVGMNDVLTKPFTPNEMQLVLKKYFKFDKASSENNVEMKEKEDESIILDESRLAEMYGGDLDFQKMVFETFIEEIPSQITEMKDLFDSENWTELAKLAHKMKPSLGMVGLTSVEENLREIETTIKGAGINDQIVKLCQQCIENFDDYVSKIKEEFNKLN
jgi:PAS domain S-box-containing protein